MPWPLRMLLRIFPLLLIAYIYTGWHIANALSLLTSISVWRLRVVVLVVIILLNLYPVIILYAFQSGNYRSLFVLQPVLQSEDYLFTFPFWLGLIITLEVAAYFLALDIIGGLLRVLPAISRQNWLKWKAVLQILLLLFIIAYAGFRSWNDTYRVRLKPYRVAVKGLPRSLEDLSITFVSDIQVDRYTRESKLKHFREIVASAAGDLLLFGGDLVTSGETFIPEGVELLCEAVAPLERIACLGDHDYWANPGRITGDLRRCGWTFLENQHCLIEYRGQTILVTGITHIYSSRISDATLKRLLEDSPAADLKIILVHQPALEIIRMARRYEYDLVLAGHTHGGQLVFRPFGIPLTATRLENQFYSGLHHYQDLPVIVTNGIGLTLAPLRYQAPAEVVKITFTPRE